MRQEPQEGSLIGSISITVIPCIYDQDSHSYRGFNHGFRTDLAIFKDVVPIPHCRTRLMESF